MSYDDGKSGKRPGPKRVQDLDQPDIIDTERPLTITPSLVVTAADQGITSTLSKHLGALGGSFYPEESDLYPFAWRSKKDRLHEC